MARASSSMVLLYIGTLFLLVGVCTCDLLNTTRSCQTGVPRRIFVFRRGVNNTNSTVAVAFPPGYNGTGPRPPVGVAVISVGDNPFRLTDSELSPIVGFQRNLRSSGLRMDDALRTQVTGVLDFQTSDMRGTIEYAGVQTIGDNIPPMEELGVTGGTGFFRAANGYIEVSVLRNVGGNVLLRNDIYLCQ